MKNVFNIVIFVLLLILMQISSCYADESTDSTVATLTVEGMNDTVYYGSEETATYDIHAENISVASDCIMIDWIDSEVEDISWEITDECTILKLTVPVGFPVGEYSFRLCCGETVSNEVSLIVLSKQFPIPNSGCVFEYDSFEHSIVDTDYDYVVTGTVCTSEVGKYTADISLPSVTNCTWSDGSTEPVHAEWEITPRQVKVSGIKAINKICDGTDSVELKLDDIVYDGVAEGDELSCTAYGVFENPKVGGGKTVFITLGLTGKDAHNYILSSDSQSETTGTITRCTEAGVVECVTDPSENFRNGSVTESDEEFLDIIMNPEMKTLVKNGADLKVWLSVSDITKEVSDYDVYRVNSAKGDSTIAAYLDINIYKQFGNQEAAEKIPEIQDKITIEIDMPKSMINTDREVNRTYQLIRVHNGVAESLDVEYDPDLNLLRFSTDRFSTYALAFTDVDKPFSPAVTLANDGNYSVLWVIVFLLICSKAYGIYLRTDAYEKKRNSVYRGRH